MQPFKLFAWDASTGRFIRVTSDPTGALNTTGGGGGGGGGAVTVADGADTAEGTTTDPSSANTVIGLLKAIKAAVQGTLAVAGNLGRSWTLSSGTDSVSVGNFPATQPVSGTVAISTSPVHVDDNAGSLTVDAPVGTPVWVRLSDGAAAYVGQKAMASSLPVVIASDQSAIPVTDNAGSLTVDAPVGTPVFSRLSDGAAALIGQKAMSASLPVVLASDQSPLPDNLAQVGGQSLASKAGGTFGQTAIPVWPNAVQRDTYILATSLVIALTAGGGDKTLLSIEHALASTKTVRIRRILLSGVVTTASAAVTGNLIFRLFTGTAASSGGTVVAAAKSNQASANADLVAKSAPTIVAAGGPLVDHLILASGAAGAVLGTFFTPITLYDWQENGETVPITLRAGQLETVLMSLNGSWATTAPTIQFRIDVIVTEE